jgi:hypothetical protein
MAEQKATHMTPKEYARAAAHHDLEIDLQRDAWLQGFTLEQRVRLGLQQEWLERTWREIQHVDSPSGR